jgi:hypothetical protein
MEKVYHKRNYYCFFISCLLILFITEGISQTIRINGGNRELTITNGIPGGQLIDVINTNCSLRYSTPLFPFQNWKVTVSTDCPDQNFNLSVVALNPKSGMAAPEVSLVSGNPAIDFITGISIFSLNSRATLQYTASATFAQGHSGDVGNDVHTVTYTLQQE